MLDACLDLLLGARCVVCGRPGRPLCTCCRDQLPRSAHVCWPTPTPPGLVVPVATGDYSEALKDLVNAHKERQGFSLAGPLGMLLAAAVTLLLDMSPDRRGSWVLVPVPSRRRTVRRRGHDPMLRVARGAASRLRSAGVPIRTGRLLRPVGSVEDQAGLDARERAVNLSGTLTCPPRRAARQAGVSDPVRCVVVDDVITTGATAREAQRALESAGLHVAGVAAVAATRKRFEVRTDWDASLPFSKAGD